MLFEEKDRGDLYRAPLFALTAVIRVLEPLEQTNRFAVNRVGLQKLLGHHTHRWKTFGYFRGWIIEKMHGFFILKVLDRLCRSANCYSLDDSLGLINHIHRAATRTEKVPLVVVRLPRFSSLGLGRFLDQGL